MAYMQIDKQGDVINVQPAPMFVSNVTWSSPHKKQRFQYYPNILRTSSLIAHEDMLNKFFYENVGSEALKNFSVQEVLVKVKKFYKELPASKRLKLLNYITAKKRVPFKPVSLFRQWGNNIKDLSVFWFLLWINAAVTCGIIYNRTKQKQHALDCLSLYVNVEKWCVGEETHAADFPCFAQTFMCNVNLLRKIVFEKDYTKLKKTFEIVEDKFLPSDYLWIKQFVHNRIEEHLFLKLDHSKHSGDVRVNKCLVHKFLVSAWYSEYKAPSLWH